MAKEKSDSPRPDLVVSLDEAKRRVSAQIEAGEEIPNVSVTDNPEGDAWYEHTEGLLRSLFTNNALADEFTGRDSWSFGGEDVSVSRFLRKLRSIYDRLELYSVEPIVQGNEELRLNSLSWTNRVFIVHGHDEEAKQTVARFLEKLQLDPVVLSEKPSEGKTIIEKFEAHSDVGFAVVLMTPDDYGYCKGDPESGKARARQNVLIELGYFVGRLTRARVCALHRGSIEIPSDLHGIVYVPMDNDGGWKLKLSAELKAAGLDVDLNRAV